MHKTLITILLILAGVGVAYATYTFVGNDQISEGNKNDERAILQEDEDVKNEMVVDVEDVDTPIDEPEQESEPEPPQQPPITKNVIDRLAIAQTLKTQESCEDAGGVWKSSMALNSYYCVLPASDAGSSCTDNSQCESWCQAPKDTPSGTPVTGNCYGFTHASCGQEIENGIAAAMWCQ